jgi:hypothetical protein
MALTEDEKGYIYEGKVANNVEDCYGKIPFLRPDEFDFVNDCYGVVVNL